MNKQKKGLKAILALLLTLALVIGMVPASVFAEATPNATRVADTETRDDYKTFLGDNNSTRYAGRVWTDKSVSTGDVQFTGDVGSVTVQNDSDFLVTYSALATSQEITRLPKIPVDVVFVLDFSGSMSWATNNEEVAASPGKTEMESSRMYAMVNALNDTIQTLVEDNDENRIGIVTFNGSSSELLPLTKASEIKDNVGSHNYLEFTKFVITKEGNGNDKREADSTVTCYMGQQPKEATTDGGTNIQAGLYEGMNMLATVTNTTYTYTDPLTSIPYGPYTRIPNIVFMSDGAPTSFSSSMNDRYYYNGWQEGIITSSTNIDGNMSVTAGDWYNGVNNAMIGSGNTDIPDSADGFMSLLMASYMKEQITAHYSNQTGLINSDQTNARVYNIGFSTRYQTEAMQEMVNVVLNPAEYLNSDTITNNAVREIGTAWTEYSQGGEATVHGAIGRSGNVEYTVPQVRGWNPTTLNYNDAYYSANNADDLNNAFQQITSAITESAKAPTEIEGNDPVNSGYITYTDTIGDYMQVDAIKALIWAGEEFEVDGEPTTVDTVTTYKFTAKDGSGTNIDSPVYGQHDVNHIIVTVTRNPGEKEVLKVEIPANSIPLRVNKIEINADGQTINKNENNGALPLRLCYTVSLQSDIKNAIGTDGTLDLENSGLDANTIADLKTKVDTNGNLTFYSNAFSGEKKQNAQDQDVTVGDATVTFTPADDNPFYFIQENTPLYTDGKEGVIGEGGGAPTTPATGSINADTTYYFTIQYYEGQELVERVIARPGSLLAGYVGGQDEQQLYIKAGAPRLGNLQDFTKNKETTDESGQTVPNNITGTADTYFYPEFIQDGDTVQDGHFLVHLGNNGKLTVPTRQQTGSITITKTDGAGEPLEGAGFTLFEVTTDPATGEVTNSTPVDLDLNDSIAPGAGTDGKYPYEKTTSYYQAIAIENPETDQNYNSSTNRYIVANSDGSTAEYIVHRDEDNNKLYYYVPIEENDIKDNMTIVAMVEFSNLDISKTYQFVETTRPNGYIQNTDGTSGAITLPVNGVYDIQYEVVNHRNISLPSSGLGGVTTLLMIGAVLVVAGAGYLILRKRKVN